MSLIASGKLAPPELVDSLLQYTPAQLNEQPFGALVLVVRVPSDDDTGQFMNQLSACAMKDVPITNESQRWPVTSHFPTMRVEDSGMTDADQVELLAELASAPHCLVPLRALIEKPILLGRGPQCNINLSDPSVSAEHAQIIIDDGGIRMRDCASKNGTHLNGRRLKPDEKPWLQPMDRLIFGRVHSFTCDARVLRGVLRQDMRTLI